MQEIQRRIGSIGTTRKISQAMKMVANAKIVRARSLVKNTRRFYEESETLLFAMLRDAAWGSDFANAQPGRTLFIVLGSDRGLCGGYNINMGKLALEQMRGEDAPVLAVIGAKLQDFLLRRRKRADRLFKGISQNPFYFDAREVGDYALGLYEGGEVARVVLLYTAFRSMLQHAPTAVQLLPFARETAEQETAEPRSVMDFLPGEEELLDMMAKQYVYAAVFNALAEGACCEQSARITSMDAAMRNAEDLIEKLQQQYNRARQEAITQELNEIVSTAEVLR